MCSSDLDLLKEYTDCDITFDINFNILKKQFKKNNIQNIGIVTQNFFYKKWELWKEPVK